MFDFDELFKVLRKKNIHLIFIIDKEYNNDFKYQIIKIINVLTLSLIENTNMQIFYTDFWNNIKTDIKNIINIKNKNYLELYFL